MHIGPRPHVHWCMQTIWAYSCRKRKINQTTHVGQSLWAFFPLCVCLDSCHNRISAHYPGFEHLSLHTLNRCRCVPHHRELHRVRLQNVLCSPGSVLNVRCKMSRLVSSLVRAFSFFFFTFFFFPLWPVQRWDQSRSECWAPCDLAARGSMALQPGGENSWCWHSAYASVHLFETRLECNTYCTPQLCI